MKIIKAGNLEEVLTGTCIKCGCVIEAEKGECSDKIVAKLIPTIAGGYFHTTIEFYVLCPYCQTRIDMRYK